jgi:ferric-dicitrate binding protein FerR (iron transport regulator)
MHKGDGKSGSGRPSTQEAAEWYAHNEVGTAFNAETLMDWDTWASDPGNRQEYAEIAEIRQQTPRAIQAPSEATRGDLMADLHSEFEREGSE